jgi:hypothetical protein
MKPYNDQSELHGGVAGPHHRRLFSSLFRRLRATRLSTVAFYFLGLLMILVWAMPSKSEIETDGIITWILGALVPLALIALTILVVQQISIESGSEMVGRPVWFSLVAVFATACAYGVIWIYYRLTGVGNYVWWRPPYIFPVFYRYGIFFAPFGWLSCLYLQRSEDEAKFATLSIRRSMLSREVAQSQLLAARAQIDPNLVVRILSAVHVQYQANSDEASKLMSHMISYLRLAMNRMGEKNPSWATEVGLIRAYCALREAEIAIKVDLQLCFADKSAFRQGKTSVPIFLMAQRLFDIAAYEGAKSLKMRISASGDSMSIALGLGTVPVSEAGLAFLRARLTELSDHLEETLHHIFESGEQWYVIEIPVEYDTNGIDRRGRI